MNYKIEEKRFLESCMISNMQGLLASDWLVPHEPNYETLTTYCKNLALEQLKQRNEMFYTENKTKEKRIEKKVDIDEIITIFNSICVALPSVSKSTIERENAIHKILETYTLEHIGNVFKLVSESDYLCGKKVEWVADFDWVLTPKNFIKILENKYKNIENGKQQSNSEIFKSAIESETGRNFRFS